MPPQVGERILEEETANSPPSSSVTADMIPTLALATFALARDVPPEAGAYPYRSQAFTRFVADAYREHDGSDPEGFYRWFEGAYQESRVRDPRRPDLALPDLLRWERSRLEAAGPSRPAQERAFAGWLFRVVKTTIPHFSLDRGFDFYQTVSHGERQCLLQSVLLAGMMQSAGMRAGTAMVWSSPKGEESNLGHVTAVARLSDGGDLIVDASDPIPTVRHRGLFLDRNGFGPRFLTPVYGSRAEIVGYRAPNGRGATASPAAFRTLDVAYLRSQFDYYRGERAPNGFLAAKPTAAGLAASARYLSRAVGECPFNPLATVVLGHVYRRQGQIARAGQIYRRALALYESDGWVAEGVREMAASPKRA